MPGWNKAFCHTSGNTNVLNPLLLPPLQVAARVTLVQGQRYVADQYLPSAFLDVIANALLSPHERTPPPRLWEFTCLTASVHPSIEDIYCRLPPPGATEGLSLEDFSELR